MKRDVIDRVIQAVAELPDRTSPDDWPEAMLVTADELRTILAQEINRASSPALPADVGALVERGRQHVVKLQTQLFDDWLHQDTCNMLESLCTALDALQQRERQAAEGALARYTNALLRIDAADARTAQVERDNEALQQANDALREQLRMEPSEYLAALNQTAEERDTAEAARAALLQRVETLEGALKFAGDTVHFAQSTFHRGLDLDAALWFDQARKCNEIVNAALHPLAAPPAPEPTAAEE